MTQVAAEITVESVEPKEGVSAKTGKPWKLYKVHANGSSFSTFDGNLGMAAFGAVGRRAKIVYDVTEKGNNLVSLIVDESSEPAVEPVRDQTPQGSPDWDMIGLHKTRCALWAAAIGSDRPWTNAGEIREWVIAAEVDIFHRQPADELADIPFS